ncbi:MAG: hypothetical protein DRI95_11855 [Bacteroidetes bacterium]|nr:MAG: hypothetical protein DRI95_11855 [Bacteroidota bacterium]
MKKKLTYQDLEKELEKLKNHNKALISENREIKADKKKSIVSSEQSISEIKLTDNKYLSEQFLFDVLMEMVPGRVYFKNRESQFIKISNSLAKWHGLDSPEAAIGKTDFDFFTKKHAKKALEDEQQIMNSGILLQNIEEKETRDNGEITWSLTSKLPITDKKGQIIGIFGISRDITDRKKAEYALKENELKLRNIFENSTNLFYSHTSDHMLTYMSPQVINVLGYTPEESMIKWTELASDNPINNIGFQHTQKAIDTGIAQAPFELELIHKNGKKVWIEVREGPVIKNGKTISIVGALIDITDRKNAEQALKDKESYKDALFHRSFTPMVVMDIKTYEFVDCNEAAIKILGYQRKEEVLGKTSIEVSTQKQYNGESSSTASKNKVKTALKEGSVLFEWKHQRPNKEVWDAEVHLMKIKHKGEELLKFSLLDITNRKKAEQALKESEEKYRLLIENQSDLVIKIDKDGRFSFVSKTYCVLFGKTEQELLGKAFMPYVYEDDMRATENAINRLHKPPHKLYFRNRAITKGGVRWVSWMYTAVLDDNKNLKEIIAVGRDITGKVKTENNLIESEQKLRKLNTTKDKFFSIIAHDLRGPFNSMLGFANLLVNKFDRFDIRKQKEFLGILADNLENTYKLLENLLLWARTQRGTIDFNPAKENLHVLTDETIELLRQSAANKAIFFINQIPEDIYVHADMNMLLTIFRNLISNAIKFTPKEGKIVISAGLTTDEYEQNLVEISVKDSGVGIEKEKRTQLFKISENISTKGTEGESGTGLGLILCKEFIEIHGGTIKVESEIWKGSSFIFTLPLG